MRNYESGGVPAPKGIMRDVMNKCSCGKTWVGPFRAYCAECHEDVSKIEAIRESRAIFEKYNSKPMAIDENLDPVVIAARSVA
jgi:hypothetical protein